MAAAPYFRTTATQFIIRRIHSVNGFPPRSTSSILSHYFHWKNHRESRAPFAKHSPTNNKRISYQQICKMATAENGTSAGSESAGSSQCVKPNRLIHEKSPYLLQHANNPVDWYPWGEEAFAKARDEDKPIFLSVGYSTCHWCHVMERESFENKEIAEIMNENFVSIKVDREERPDVDKVYMTFVQATTGSGGWPMSVWLTPDLKPILGGTYFPPNDRYYGRPGFATILKLISKQWRENREKVMDQGGRIVDILVQSTVLRPPEEAGAGIPGKTVIMNCFAEFCHRYDDQYGGFGSAPKFPQPVNLNFLFYLYAKNPLSIEGKKALEMCLHTLIMMAKGGIHDHVAKGFHRYSTDQYWHVPHFEKMLYDQGQLAVAYLTAYQITKDRHFADVARDILEYVSRDMTDQHGGFYSAEDADSLPSHDSVHKREGAFCVWAESEIRKLLDFPVSSEKEGQTKLNAADIVCFHFDVKPEGNVDPYQDPHEELKNQNVLIIRGDEEKTAEHFGISVELLKDVITKSLRILYEARLKRPKPHLDDKIVTSWNGLMISGFAKGAQVLDDSEFVEKATKAAKFLYQYAYDEETKRLKRSVYKGSDGSIVNTLSPIPGVLEDYVFLIRGLLDLYEASYDPWCLEWANELQEVQDRLFWDRDHGGYFNSVPDDPTIILRLKEDQDGAEPSPNSVSVSNLIRLSTFMDQPELHDRAARIIATFSSRLDLLPHALPQMICGIMHLGLSQQVIVVGEKEDAGTKALLRQVHSHFLPFKVTIFADGNTEGSILYKKLNILKKLEQQDGKATAYVCTNQSCSLPVTCTEELERLLLEPHEVFQF